MATPHVSGILACHYQHDKKMTNIDALIKLYTYSSSNSIVTKPKPIYGNIYSGPWLALLPREKPPELCHRGTQNGDINFCHSNCKCSHGEGDCDNDDQCKGGTYCGNGFGAYFGMASVFDVCVSYSYVPPQPSIHPTSQPTDCHNKFNNGDVGYCQEDCQCQNEEGSCLSNSECVDGTTCLEYCDKTIRGICYSWKHKCVWSPSSLPIPSPTNYPFPIPTNKPTSHPTEEFRYLVSTYNSNALLKTVGPTNNPTKTPVYIETIPPTLQDSSGTKLNSSNMLWIMLVIISCSTF